MNAALPTSEAGFVPMSEALLDAVLAVEAQAHPHPWQRPHFADCLTSGYQAQLLLAERTLLGYFVAMQGFEEVHLLNLTVAPAYQRQGWSRLMLDALAVWAGGLSMQNLWLEVRASNTRAVHVYKANGFRYVGLRKRYYPAANGAREDALVMNRKL